jgi:hypothetical protein
MSKPAPVVPVSFTLTGNDVFAAAMAFDRQAAHYQANSRLYAARADYLTAALLFDAAGYPGLGICMRERADAIEPEKEPTI